MLLSEAEWYKVITQTVFREVEVCSPDIWFADSLRFWAEDLVRIGPHRGGTIAMLPVRKRMFSPDFRQKSHFRCLKGSEVQDFRAFLL